MLSEALKIITGEYSMHRISAYILQDNIPSISLVEKLGFELEGTAKAFARLSGKWTDHLHYVYIVEDIVEE